MSKHRSPESTEIGHRGNRRPIKKRNKTAIVTAIALVLTGAAFSAHAKFARDTSHVRVASDVHLSAKAAKQDALTPTHPWWTPNWSQWSKSWRAASTSPSSTSPTTTRPSTSTTPTKSPTTTSSTRTASPSPTTSTRTTSTPPPPNAPAISGQRWAGHVPGKFYLGMSCGSLCAQKEKALSTDYGVHRQFKSWGNWSGVAKAIQLDQGAGRLPWISIKSPNSGPSGWQAVANGQYDNDIKALATVLKANDNKPVLLTFHHEPSNDGSESQGKLWAAAYCRFHDVLKAQGALVNVADPPILGDWLFNPTNRQQDPVNWLTAGVMQRMPFLGIDMYENTSGETYAVRVPRIVDWMAQHGYPNKMVGIGETGATDRYRSQAGVSAAQWITASLTWAAAHTDMVGVVSYFNSTQNSRSTVYWPLDESAAKLAAYKAILATNSKVVTSVP